MVRIAVVGAGRWGTHWTRIGLEHPEFQLEAVVDPIAASLDRMTERYGSRPHWQDVKLCPSLAEAIAAASDTRARPSDSMRSANSVSLVSDISPPVRRVLPSAPCSVVKALLCKP